MNKININSFLISFSIFFCSLDSYLRERGLVGLCFLFFILFISEKRSGINIKYVRIVLLLFVFYILYTALAFFYPGLYLQVEDDRGNFIFKVIDRLSLIVLFILIFLTCADVNIEENLYSVTWIHVFFFYAQLFLWVMLDIKIDFVSLIFGVVQRNEMGFGQELMFRPAGLYIEPSNYAAYVACMFSCYIIKNNNYKLKDYLIPCSIMLTLSSAAFVIGLMLLVAMLIKAKFFKRIRTIVIFLFLAIPLVIYMGSKQVERFGQTGIVENSNTALRLNLLSYVYNSRLNDLRLTALGDGIYSIDKNIYDMENHKNGRTVASVQDASFFVYAFIFLGFIGLASILFLFRQVQGVGNKMIIFAVLLSKISFLFPIFAFFVFFLIKHKLKIKSRQE